MKCGPYPGADGDDFLFSHKVGVVGLFSHLSLQQISRLMSVNLTSRRSIHQLLNPEKERKRVDSQMSPQLEFGLGFC